MRSIFACYLELGNVRQVTEHLERDGIRSPCRMTARGKAYGGVLFSRGQSYKLLRWSRGRARPPPRWRAATPSCAGH